MWVPDVVVSEWSPTASMSAFAGCGHAALHAQGGNGPILLQKSAGLVGPFFSGPWRRRSKKHVGVYSKGHSGNQGLSQPRGKALEQGFFVAPALTSFFEAPTFSTFDFCNKIGQEQTKNRPITSTKRVSGGRRS
jgi:hypothetical protein